jgi:hypothetical protein
MTPSRSLLTFLACGALGVTLAACGASSGGGAAASTTPTSAAAPTSAPATSASAASSTPADSSAAASSIAANWTAFFDAKTPVAKRVSLLEDGQEFATVIKSQAGGGLAAAATAKVTRVTVTSASQATVVYNILVAGQAALSNQSGTAVLQDGTWKVGLASFCGLLSLEAGGKTSGLPAPCKSVG